MRQYIFAKVMYKVNSTNLSGAIECFVREYPTENISEQIKTEKIVLVDTVIIPSERKFKVRHPFEFCKKCNTMHRKDSANWKRCFKQRDVNL